MGQNSQICDLSGTYNPNYQILEFLVEPFLKLFYIKKMHSFVVGTNYVITVLESAKYTIEE